MYEISTAAFALAVAIEFILISIITFSSVYFDNYFLWLGAFMGFFIHLIVHIIQWAIIRKYIPTIVTTILVLPYCIYTVVSILTKQIYPNSEIILWTIIGAVLIVPTVILSLKVATKLDKFVHTDNG